MRGTARRRHDPAVQTEPDLAADRLIDYVGEQWGLAATGVRFLPIGDALSAHYRVEAGQPYFLKLRRGGLADLPVAVPRLLAEQGVRQVIPPRLTRTGPLTAELDGYAATLCPYVEGRTGFQRDLSDRDWIELGAALRAVHATRVPAALADRLPREDYSPRWRDAAPGFLDGTAAGTAAEPGDPVAAGLAALLAERAGVIGHLADRAGRLAGVLRQRRPPLVLCHSDIHAGNVLISDTGASTRLYVIDWDEPVLAPKERDLMFVGAGIGDRWNRPRQAELFYQGYGPADVDPVAVAYYRYERIVVDVVLFCQEILLPGAPAADRERALVKLAGGFGPGSVTEIACRTDDEL
jgi:spectinomycin phosphotransferase